MPAFYPCSIWSPTVKTNKVDLVDASHINQSQYEIVAIQEQLQVGLDSDGSVISGTAFPSPAKPSQQFWRTDLGVLYIFTGVLWSPQSGVVAFTAGDYKVTRNPTPIVTGIVATTYTKIAEIYIPRSGVLRVKFWLLGASTGQSSLGRIYRNAAAVGTERTTTVTTGTQYSEDISGWSAGDLLQLYAKTSNAADAAKVGGLELFEGAPETTLLDDVTYRVPKHYVSDAAPTAYTGLGAIGDTFINTSGGTSTTLYIKTDATTWTAK